MCSGGRYSFPGLLYFTLDPYLIMLSVKQGGIKYHFLSLWYDSTRSPGPLANTLTPRPMSGSIYIYIYIYNVYIYCDLFISNLYDCMSVYIWRNSQTFYAVGCILWHIKLSRVFNARSCLYVYILNTFCWLCFQRSLSSFLTRW